MGCATPFPNQKIKGSTFPSVLGDSLDGKKWKIPEELTEKTSILILGYKQNSQFDIDRWLIGIDQLQITTKVYELPTIKGFFPRMFKPYIDNGMKKGIPKDMWGGVITIYKDGKNIQKFTGNENPNNARVVVINNKGVVQFFYDEGFSTSALNKLKSIINE